MFHIRSIYLSGSHDLDIHKDPSEVLWSDRHCHSRVEKLPIVLHLVFTVLPVTPSSTHTAQSPAFAIQSPIPIGPSCSSMTQKEVCQSATWTGPMCDFFFVSSCTEECLRVLMHFCHFLNDVMFSYSFASFLLCSSTGSAAPLCFPLHQPHSLLCFLSLLSLYLCLSSLVGFQAGQQSVWEFQLLFFFVLSFFLSLFLIVLQ